jgi:ABC-type nitrate/sulfonate/bicarbonate transport system substrate-binding protein
MKHRILSVLFLSAFMYRMAEDAPAATPPTHTDVSVPVEHESTVSRLLALLEKGEQWIVDNVEAGLKTLENMFADATPQAPAEDADEMKAASTEEAANAATEQPEA